MARYLGEVVHFTPHDQHTHLAGQPEYAAIVGRVYPDGSADLFVLVPNKEAHWQDAVPEGDTHHTHRSITPPTDTRVAALGSRLSALEARSQGDARVEALQHRMTALETRAATAVPDATPEPPKAA